MLEEGNIEAGDIAPDFELPTDTGEKVRLSDLRGKHVVLYFYPKDDTHATKDSLYRRSQRLNTIG